MKKSFILALAAVSLASSSQVMAWGLSWESLSGMGNEAINPVAYNIEVNGNNLRVYEWITPTRPQQKCVFVASERSTDLQCNLVTVDLTTDEIFEKVNEE